MSSNGGVVTGELVLDTTKFINSYDKAMDHVRDRAAEMSRMGNPISDQMQKAQNAVADSSKKIVNDTTQMNRSVQNSLIKTGDVFRDNANLTDEWNNRLNSGKISMDQFDRILKDVQFSSAAAGFNVKSLSNDTAKFNNNLKEVPSSGDAANKSIDAMGNSSTRSVNALRSASRELHTFKKGLSVFGVATGVFTGLLGFTAVMSLGQVANASINAHYNIEKMARGMQWSTEETQAYINKMNELQNVYKKIDMRFVASETATIARMYKLTSQQAKMAIEPVGVLTDAFIREGRTQTDAMLAVKDLVDQGQGWQRRLGEIGVTTQQLESVGWSGDKNDKLGLLNALGKVEEKLSLTAMAQEVYTLEDALNVLNIAGGQFLADVLIPMVPYIVAATIAFSNFLGAIKWVGGALLGFWATIPDVGKFVLIAVAIGAVAAAVGILAMYIWVTGIPAIAAYILALMNTLIIGPLFGVSALSIAGGVQIITAAFLELSIAGAPVWAVALAVIALTVVVYELGVVFGWWTDLSSFGAAIMACLTEVWNGMVWAGQQLYDVILNISNAIYGGLLVAWNGLVYYGQQVYGIMNRISGIANYIFGTSGSGDWLVDAWSRLLWLGTTLYNIIMTVAGAFSILTSASSGSGGGFLGGLWAAITKIPEAFAFIVLSFMDWALSIDWIGIFERAVSGIEGVINSIIGFLETFDFSLFFGGQEAGELAGQKLVDGVSKTANPSKFELLFQKVAAVMARIDWGAVLGKIGELMFRIGVVILQKLHYIAWLLLYGLATAIWTGVTSVNWGAVGTNITNALITGIAKYNPITLIIGALFGENAGTAASNAIMGALQGLTSIGPMIMSFIFGGGSGGSPNIVERVTSWFTSVDWNAVIVGTLNTIFTLVGHYNPITMLMVLLFGPEAGMAVQTQIVEFLWLIVNTFMMGLQTLYDTIVWVGTSIYNAFTWTWNTIYFYVMTIWNLLYMGAVAIWNPLYAFFMWIWSGIQFMATWVWNNVYMTIYNNLIQIWNTAIWIGNAIWGTITGVFNRIYSTVAPIFQRILSAWHAMRDGLTSAANTIRDAVWSPIKSLWDKLTGFWNWITHPFGGGSSGGSSGGRAGPRPAAGPRPRGASGGNYAGGFFGGVMNAAFDYTEARTGHRPIGGYYSGPSGLGDGNAPDDCSPENPCYAGGYDFSKVWVDEALRLVNAWHMDINGMSFNLQELSQKGNLGLFAQIATKLISPTHYDYYYNGRYSDREALSRRAFNCFDGAEILIHLAQAMGLSASMGHTMWGNDGHAYALINGIPFDTTALQHGYGWTAPQVRYSGPNHRGGYAGEGSVIKRELHIHFNRDVYGIEHFKQVIHQIAKGAAAEYVDGEVIFYE